MDRTPPTANGYSSKQKVATNTTSSPIRRVAPSSNSPKFPPIKKLKTTSPKKIVRATNRKGVVLPKVSSVTFSSEIGTQEVDSGEELEVLKCILVREGYLQRLGRANTVGNIAGVHLSETVDVLDLLRLASLETVEAIVIWRIYKQKKKTIERNGQQSIEQEQFKWNGINYLLKMASDLEFLGKHLALIEWLGFVLQRNPFILPLNLDCRSKLQVNLHPTERNNTTESNYFLQVGGKRVHSTGNTENSTVDNEALALALAERKRAKTPYETRIINDEELVPNTPSKIRSLHPKSQTLIRSGKSKYSSVLPSQIGEIDMARLHEAELVILQEESVFGRYTRDLHGRVVPEDEARRRFNMVELSGNVYNVPATLESAFTCEDSEGNGFRLGDSSHSDIPGKLHAKKRSGMLGPISKPEWRSFHRPPPPRRRARGAQLEQALAAERKANAQLGVLLDTLREETERKAMDVAYFESCSELQVYGEELQAFTTQAQRELSELRREFEEKKYMYERKLVNIQKKEEMLHTFKTQHKAVQDATHVKRIEEQKIKVVSLNQEQQQREDREQAALREVATAQHQEHERSRPLVLHFCATEIQKIARGMLARERYEQMKIEFIVASTFIQAGVRGFLVRRRVAAMYWRNLASVHIQRIVRGWLARLVVKTTRIKRFQKFSAERIQKIVRGHFGRNRMLQTRELVNWRLQFALAARAMNVETLKELAAECQEMVALPNVMKTEAKSVEKRHSLPALVLGLVRVLMIFTSDSDDEWNIPIIRWREAAKFLRCGVSITRRMQKIADVVAGSARAFLSPSGSFAAAGVAASTPYLRESVLGTKLLKAFAGDLNFRVETFEKIPRGWQAAVVIFKWTTAFAAIIRLQHLIESNTRSNDPFLVVLETLSKREILQEVIERRDVENSEEDVARRFVPAQILQAQKYPFHRPRPLLLVVANDVPRKAKLVILEKLQTALPGLFLTISRPPVVKKRSLGVEDTSEMFDFQAITNALALGHCVILEADVGLRDVTQRAFLSCFATIKSGLHPPPMCILLRGTFTNRSDLFSVKQGSDKEEEANREEMRREMVDADVKLALDRTTRLRLELAEEAVDHEMIQQSESNCTPSSAMVIVMEAVIVLLTPGKMYGGPSQSDIATSSVSWRLSRRLLAQPAFLRTKLQQVDITTIPPVNLVALERFLQHSLWPNAEISRSQVHSSRLLYALAVWVESVTRTAQMIAADGTGSLAPEITRFRPTPGLFERVVIFDNCPTDHVQDGAGEDSSILQLMDAVLADVRVYRTAHLLESSSIKTSSHVSKKKINCDGTRCVVSLFHECQCIFVSVYSPSTGERWMTTISEDKIDSLLTPSTLSLGTKVRADKLPPQSHTEMYSRLARLCLLQKRRLEDIPGSLEGPSPYELVVRPRAVQLYRHVLQLGGYLTTITIVELARGQAQVNAFVHGSSSHKPLEQAVELTLAVELEKILSRLSAAQARSIFVPSARIPSLLLDRLHLYSISRSPMVFPEFQQNFVSALKLSVRTNEISPGHIILRRAVRAPGNEGDTSGERWLFTLVERHELGTFEAVFYSPGSSKSHCIPLSRAAAQELLFLSKHSSSSQVHNLLLRSFCFSKPVSKVLGDSESENDEEEVDTMTCYRQRRCILARFPCVLRTMENPHQRINKKQLVRVYVQVELCDDEESTTQRNAVKIQQVLQYRMWLPESCVEQSLKLEESKIEASLPVELSWQQAQLKERREISRQVVKNYFAWDPKGRGTNGCVVVHLPCGSLWATEVTPAINSTTNSHEVDRQSSTVLEEAEIVENHLSVHENGGKSHVNVVSCTHLLDDRATESDDEDDDEGQTTRDSKRGGKCYSYDTEELVHRGSYRANGLYLVVRVTMKAEVIRDLKPALVSLTDRVQERDSFTIKFHVYHPVSSCSAVAEIHGYRDLREVVGPNKSVLIASTTLDSLVRHVILTRLDAQVDRKSSNSETYLIVTFLRDRLYAKQKATPLTKTFDRDSSVNASKLIDESRHRGRAGERGIKILTTAKVVSGCGRTLFTVFNVATNGQTQQSTRCSVMLRVDAYVCATSEKLSLLLEGSDLVHLVGSEDREVLSRVIHDDANSAEMEKQRSRKLATIVLDHLRVEQRSDGRGDRLVLSDYTSNFPDALDNETTSKKLFQTVRAVGHDQVLITVYLDKGMKDHLAMSELRLELYDPSSSSRCKLIVSHDTLGVVLGLLEYDNLLGSSVGKYDLMMHVLSFVHIEQIAATSDGTTDRQDTFSMTLLFDEQRGLECMKQHGNGNDSKGMLQESWTGPAKGRDGNYISMYLQIRCLDQKHTHSSDQWLVCSAFAPSEMLVDYRSFKWADIPPDLRTLQSGTVGGDTTLFFMKVCERLIVEIHQDSETPDYEAAGGDKQYEAARPRVMKFSFT